MELRRKGLLYIRDSATIPAGTKNYELIKYIIPKYDEIRFGEEIQTKASITHLGNSYSSGLIFKLEYGELWRFEYQIGKTNDPFQFPVPLAVDSEEINVLVDNNGSSDLIAEIVIVGYYERERFKKLDKQIPSSLGNRKLF